MSEKTHTARAWTRVGRSFGASATAESSYNGLPRRGTRYPRRSDSRQAFMPSPGFTFEELDFPVDGPSNRWTFEWMGFRVDGRTPAGEDKSTASRLTSI